ncbi:hypothetical protein C0995_013207 [Termitomyces sp. Mi166|nr:hypothetical protein C0995_013207 [Termitomyces sp. Mi166\
MPVMPPSLVPALLSSCLALLLYLVLKWIALRRAMPPGPMGIPLFGNRHQLPAVKPWRKFAEWNKQYGPAVSIFLGSTPVITAWDLLEKRSEIYSSRPRFIVAGEILSDNKRGLMLPNNEFWRKWRKVLHTGFHSRQADSYRDIQNLESKIMLYQILTDPEHYEQHLKRSTKEDERSAASVVSSVSYGLRVDNVDEWVIKENMAAMDYLTRCALTPYVQAFNPPAISQRQRSLQWFRREPEERRQRDIKFLMHLFNDVKSRMQTGTADECLTLQTITNQAQSGLTDLDVAYTVSSPFGAGIETTAGTLTIFILAMLHFPSVMRKAQAELDHVVGLNRMPEFDDKDSLPYVKAVVNETLR